MAAELQLADTYTAADVAAQIKAAKDAGINSLFLWNDSSKVGIGAPALLPGDPAGNNKPGAIMYSINKPGNRSDGSTRPSSRPGRSSRPTRPGPRGGREGTFKNPLDEDSTATSAPTSASDSTPEPSATATP